MSYHGSVTCSVCYSRGHNKRSCPEYTERLQKNFDSYKDRHGMEDYTKKYGDELAKRTGIDPWTGKKAAKEQRMKKYTCSYCQTEGHTRRTCEFLKEDKAVYSHITCSKRAKLLKEVEELGIGLGTVIPNTRQRYDNDVNEYVKYQDPMFIVRYRWDQRGNFDPKTTTVFVGASLSKLGKLGVDHYSGGPITKAYSIDKLTRLGKENLVIGALPNMREKTPKGWLDGTDINYASVFPCGDYRSWEYREYADDEHVTEARLALGFDT